MRILIVTIDQFPSGDAGSVRLLSFCEILKDLGHEVIVIGQADVQPYVSHSYRGFEYFSLRSVSKKYSSRIMNYIGNKNRMKKIITKLSETKKIDSILITLLPINSLFYLKKLARRNNIKLFHDSVEWFSPQNFKWGFLSIFYLINELWNRVLIDHQFSVISISSFLDNHFSARNIRSIRIPVILDTSEIAFRKHTNSDRLEILYAGSPAKKDYLKEVIEGMTLLNEEERKRIKLQLIGVNLHQLVGQCNVNPNHIKICKESLQIVGRIPREEVIKYLNSADFTVLIRSSKLRYAKAGFPTKVAESLATATPVICNLTSDLGLYLKDGENSIIVESATAYSFMIALRKALALSKDDKQEMCHKARQTAEMHFDFNIYTKQMEKFLAI